jgi:hypothetical protein
MGSGQNRKIRPIGSRRQCKQPTRLFHYHLRLNVSIDRTPNDMHTTFGKGIQLLPFSAK